MVYLKNLWKKIKRAFWLESPFKTYWKARKHFKKPVFQWYFCRVQKKQYYEEDVVISGKVFAKKGDPYYTNCGIVPFASLNYIGSGDHWWNKFIQLVSWDVGWKDKWETPRYERPPIYMWFIGTSSTKSIEIGFILAPCREALGKYKGVGWWGSNDEHYWEQILWTVYYCDNDIVKARETWPWQDMEGNSTWRDDYLTDKTLKLINGTV